MTRAITGHRSLMLTVSTTMTTVVVSRVSRRHRDSVGLLAELYSSRSLVYAVGTNQLVVGPVNGSRTPSNTSLNRIAVAHRSNSDRHCNHTSHADSCSRAATDCRSRPSNGAGRVDIGSNGSGPLSTLPGSGTRMLAGPTGDGSRTMSGTGTDTGGGTHRMTDFSLALTMTHPSVVTSDPTAIQNFEPCVSRRR